MQILPPTSKVVLLFLPTSHVVFTMLYVCKSSVLSTVVKSITKLLSMPFDLIKFNGGLKTVGIPSKMVCNIQHYGIKHYQDLDPFLGSFWHYRGLNVNGDYGYVQLDTVSFLCKSRSLVEYFPPSSDSQPPSKTVTHTGHTLSFSFVCKYGIGSTFGKDKQFFV